MNFCFVNRSLLCFKAFIFLSAALLFVSCAVPNAVVRMDPVSDYVSWNYGQAYISDTVNGIIVQAAFDRANQQYTIFDLEVSNLSSLNYLVDPSTFVLKHSCDSGVHAVQYRAIDPEKMLLDMDLAESQAIADEKNASTMAVVAATAIVATTVVAAVAADDDYDDNHNHHADDDNVDVFLTTNLISEQPSQDAYSRVEEARVMWSEKTLRKTTLKTYEKIVGKVYFSRFDDESVYILQIPVDDEYIEIPFRQKLYMPTSAL